MSVTKDKNLNTEGQISDEHTTNNKSVRQILLDRKIVPENLPAEEDIKKLEQESIKKKSTLERILIDFLNGQTNKWINHIISLKKC
ncbi:MAG: hypothetical protein AAF847_14955 [Bacteroidota bacterium]